MAGKFATLAVTLTKHMTGEQRSAAAADLQRVAEATSDPSDARFWRALAKGILTGL
jgi:hypothetical protein